MPETINIVGDAIANVSRQGNEFVINTNRSELEQLVRDVISQMSWTATCNADGTITITAD